MWAVKHKSGTVLFFTNSERTANNRREMGWIVEEVKMTSREQFEQKIQHEYGDDYLAVNDDGDYINWITSDLWEYWVASRAAIEIELPTTIEVHPLGPSAAKMFCDLHKNTVAECAKSIRASGLKIKGE